MADSLEDEAQAILAAMREAHASLPAVWEQSFSTWLEAITDDLQKSLERARRRKDARRVAELTNALDCIVPIREIRAQSPTGAELALHVVVLMEALAVPISAAQAAATGAHSRPLRAPRPSGRTSPPNGIARFGTSRPRSTGTYQRQPGKNRSKSGSPSGFQKINPSASIASGASSRSPTNSWLSPSRSVMTDRAVFDGAAAVVTGFTAHARTSRARNATPD